jgi:uncharacterized protein (DUF2062 family)
VTALSSRFKSWCSGLTPEKVALLIAVGFVFGTFPVLGLGGVLCALAALVLRLNLPALQAVGQLVTPAQYALLWPLARLGGHMLRTGGGLRGAVAGAVAGWLCVCVPLGVLIYAAVWLFLRARRRPKMEALESDA